MLRLCQAADVLLTGCGCAVGTELMLIVSAGRPAFDRSRRDMSMPYNPIVTQILICNRQMAPVAAQTEGSRYKSALWLQVV